MGDQLSLELAPVLPVAPATLRPMLPRPAEAPFDSPDHLFEPSWGGRRVLAFLEPAVDELPGGGYATADGRPSVRLMDAEGVDLAPRLPELAGLALRIEANSAVVDGELVIVDRSGRADPGALATRLAGADGPAVAYLVFDLLYIDGRPLLAEPLVRRRERLARILRPGPEIVAVPAIATDGSALFAAAAGQGLAGVLARARTSPYLPGVRSRLWRYVRSDAVLPGGPAATPVTSADEAPIEAANAPVLALIQRLPLDED